MPELNYFLRQSEAGKVIDSGTFYLVLFTSGHPAVQPQEQRGGHADECPAEQCGQESVDANRHCVLGHAS